MEKLPEKILSEKIMQGKTFYQIKWKSKEGTNITWEAKNSLGEELKNLEKDFLERQQYDQDQDLNSDNEVKKKIKKDKQSILNFNKNNQTPVSIDDMYGDLESGDRPKSILKVRKLKNEIEFIVEWEQRPDKFQPKESVVTNTELKKYCPDMLMRFYENNIVFQVAN